MLRGWPSKFEGTTLDQQKILGYFIEEAQEHLETLERGILDLGKVVRDSEQVNEMFRAAHSVKGGAAMLGYTSIQKTAHRLEDAFKVLKEHQLPVDQKLESLFLNGYDVLQDLVEKLQSPSGLQPEEADSIVDGASHQFEELQNYLNYLLTQGSATATSTQTMAAKSTNAGTFNESDVPEEIKALLHKMLQLFKQEPSATSREKLQEYCTRLGRLAPKQENWQHLLSLSKQAIANPLHSYRTLAPVVLKDLKQGYDCFTLAKPENIRVSDGLKQLASSHVAQVLIPAEPTAAANILMKVFNESQLRQLIKNLSASH
ncbi:Hpt domain-containing protein [Synechocystis sp. FACHB-383]|uniref:Hpt domain-containing protein n=1 Tax=Synechocystis salina LEGE 00031 TaxID=1828736 RepID=A0ABR9VTE8_9SYNC|nr:Hpt domain-containing protein [Synechocystis sp. FACHB-383]MBE9196908.1 Hpt domain-containing protein [Synechocystis sp. LEGE 06083]MBE9242542.1 Hpt domain-containing protein [Synechocystis salina LEGE 00041]MBE9254619.1 Hpt domain-containing protein [Synechocystis salina LEGE 00031]